MRLVLGSISICISASGVLSGLSRRRAAHRISLADICRNKEHCALASFDSVERMRPRKTPMRLTGSSRNIPTNTEPNHSLRWWGAIALLLLLMVLTVGTKAATPAPTPAAPATLKELDERLAALFVQRGIPGASLALIEDGKVTYLKGYGVADKAKGLLVTPDTVFRAASISKSFTSIALMRLVEAGKLTLDARLADVAPEVKFTNPWEQTDPLRLVHLLEHSSGWPDISTRVEAADGRGWALRQGVEYADREYVSRWKPGQFAVYSNSGPAVAGYVLEKLTGQDFSSFERNSVLRPMGMASADFDLPPELAGRLAKSYGPNGTETPYKHIILPPSGSLATSVRELSRLVLFFIGRGSIEGQQILMPTSVERIERGESSLASKAGLDGAFGLGNFPLNDKGVTYRGHNGQIDSFTSVYGYSVAQRTGYVVMANGGEGVDYRTPVTALIQAYLNRGHAFTPPPGVPVAQRDLDAWAGFYRNVTPAKDLMRPYADVLGLTRVTVANSTLFVGGREFIAVTPHSFRRVDRDNASLAFIEKDGEVYALSGGFGDRKREAGWRIAMAAVFGGLALLGGACGLLLLPVWLVSAYRKRLTAKGGWNVRIFPLLAFATLSTTLVLPLFAIESGIDMLEKLAEPSVLAISIFLCSILFPVLAVTGLWHAVRTRNASRWVRWYAGLTSGSILVISGYALAIGWVGLRTWTM